METNKEVVVTTRVDKRIVDALKKISKQKEIRFSSYIKRILINEVEKEEIKNK